LLDPGGIRVGSESSDSDASGITYAVLYWGGIGAGRLVVPELVIIASSAHVKEIGGLI
jgi:hypothetical protein